MGIFARTRRLLSLPSLQSKLVIPYALLTLLLTVFGIFILTRLVTSSVRERFLNQLFEASRVAADGIVLKEREHLENLRLMSYTTGLAQALVERDVGEIEKLLLPLAINNRVDILTVIDSSGVEVLTLGRDKATGQYIRVHGKDFHSFPPVAKILEGQADEKGDKFSAVLEVKGGTALFTSTAVHKETGELAGVLLTGTYLEELVSDLKNRSLADILMLDKSGNLFASSLPPVTEEKQVLEETARTQISDPSAQTHTLKLFKRGYQVFYSPLLIRSEQIGWLGVLLPDQFVISTEVTSRNAFSLLFTAGTLLILLIGRRLAINISRPILQLSEMAENVARGDLQGSIQLQRSDEVGVLARSFNIMTQHLRERTAEANRLYEETNRRNQELGEINLKLRNTQEQLVQSEKLAAVGQLTAGIVHDVKNPLAAIQGMAEFMSKDPSLPGDARQDITVIYESAVKATKIVTDLLKFARQAPPEVKQQDLRETIYAALFLNRYLIQNGNVKVSLGIPKKPVIAAYDAQQVEQVLINLIQNALQAMPRGGNLKLGLAQVNGNAQIHLQDTGLGIPPEKVKRIFEPFFTTKANGTGLGLSTSYGIIASHHGEISVQSQVNQGTSFTISLPLQHKNGPDSIPGLKNLADTYGGVKG